ncbi:protein IWS1 homolog [Punica granatum]|uniref:Protein IWS1 homolog n=2 Tax=Punica granatum TaxID=22663 RepID=A0A6P8C677_PUNGR|nr:protein IWS1 homolog [Punica granatum]
MGLEELSGFITRVDSKIRLLLKGLRAQGHEMTLVFEALRNYQESMKTRLKDVINIAFDTKNKDEALIRFTESEESIALVEALTRFFWKKEEQIDARLNKCCEVFGAVGCQEPKEESRPAEGPDQAKGHAKREEDKKLDKKPKGPAKNEEGQELDMIDLKGSSEESEVGKDTIKVLQPQMPSIVSGSSVAEDNLEHEAAKSEEAQELDLNPKDPAKSEEGQEPDEKAKDPAKSEEDQVLDIEPTGPAKSEEAQEPDIKLKGPAKSEEAQEPDMKPKGPAKSDEGPKRNKRPKGPESEETQEPDIIDLKGSVSGSLVAEENLEHAAAHPGIHVKFSQLIRGIQRVDEKIESLLTNVQGNSGEMKSAVEKMKDSQEGLKARLNKLKERCFKTVGKEENLEVVGSTARGVLVLKSVLRSLTEEEQEIEAQVDERMASLQVTAPRDSSGLLGTADEEKPKENKEPDGGTFNVESSNDSLTRPDPVVPDTGRSEEVMTTGISVTVEAEPGSEEDQLSAHDLSLPESADLENLVDRKLTEFINLGITEEDFKAMDETRKIEIEIGDMLMSLQKSFAQGLMHHATKIHVEVSVMLAELFLLLSTNVKEKLFKFQAFRSCLKDIEEDKSDAKVVKWILEVLKVADEELKKMKTSTRQGQKC